LDATFPTLPEPGLRTPPSLRWAGEGLELPEGILGEADQADLRRLYDALRDGYEAWLSTRSDPDWTALAARIRAFGEPPLSHALERLGAAPLALGDAVPAVARRALHDLRGGAFFALRLYGVLMDRERPTAEEVEPAILLARDQAKVVRSLVPSIDPEGYARDRAERAHGMRELVDKWEGFTFPAAVDSGSPGPRVEVECLWRGDLAARCLEAAALDRVLYNLVNNAARFTADGRVRLRVDRVAPGTARIAVTNPVDPVQVDWLGSATEAPGDLFRGGVSRGGRGLGLWASASVVARAWGQVDAEDAAALGVVGAKLSDGEFAAWFLWPILNRRPGVVGGSPPGGGAS
jgi:signal transduction histidine kinase